MRILLADGSDALGAAELTRVLAAGGHETQLVGDGVSALRVARRWSPRLVLAAVQLPRMDGLVLTAALGALGTQGTSAVVLVGPEADFHARSRGRALGIAAYLPLPLDVTALLQLAWSMERRAPVRAPGARRRAG